MKHGSSTDKKYGTFKLGESPAERKTSLVLSVFDPCFIRGSFRRGVQTTETSYQFDES